MDIVKVNLGINWTCFIIGFWSLVLYFSLGNKRLAILRKICVCITVISACIMLYRIGYCRFSERFYYVNEIGFSHRVGLAKINLDELEWYGISKEMLDNANPYDMVEISLKKDTSSVSFLDILLCKNEKWLEAKIVGSTEYVLLEGKDIDLEVEKMSRSGNEVVPYVMETRYYINYKGCLYRIKPKSSIEDGKMYVLIWDSLSKSKVDFMGRKKDCYKVCTLVEYSN